MVIDPATTENVFQYFHHAKVIVGAHGAGLANIAVSSRSCSLLELFSPHHIFPYPYTLADAANVNYACMLGDDLGIGTSSERRRRSPRFTVSLEQFLDAVTETCVRSGA
jgi:hypothetical protein